MDDDTSAAAGSADGPRPPAPPPAATGPADPPLDPAVDPGCVFCRMVSRDIQADEVIRTDSVVAFRDISPQAPTHVLVVPLAHHRDLAALTRDDPAALAEMARVAAAVAAQECPGGWRWVFNSGADSGQSVLHVHGHVLGGRRMTWPPG